MWEVQNRLSLLQSIIFLHTNPSFTRKIRGWRNREENGASRRDSESGLHYTLFSGKIHSIVAVWAVGEADRMEDEDE